MGWLAQIRPKPAANLDPNEQVLEKPRFLKQQDLTKLEPAEFLAHLLWHYYPIKKLADHAKEATGLHKGALVCYQLVDQLSGNLLPWQEGGEFIEWNPDNAEEVRPSCVE